jgi:hypothetical protein
MDLRPRQIEVLRDIRDFTYAQNVLQARADNSRWS